jgi:hypothetical protein
VLVCCVLWRVRCLRGCSFIHHGDFSDIAYVRELHPCSHNVSSVESDVFLNIRRDSVSDFRRRIADVSDGDIQLCKVRRQTVTVDVVAVVFTSDARTWQRHRGRRVCPIPCRNASVGKHAVMHSGCMRRCKLGPACQHPRNQCLRREIP